MTVPVALTPLIGREPLITSLRRQLEVEHVRLLTLTGSGGVGKTRVALQVLAETGGTYRGGRHFVALAPIRDPDLMLTTVADALGAHQVEPLPLLDQLRRFFVGPQLLVLDNFEHLAPAAGHVAALLAACPELTVLVTSRARLHLSGEYEVPVPPLDLPPEGARLDYATLGSYSAVALFVQRARAINPGFVLNAANAWAVAQICRRLDGLPLSLELAAARSKLLPPPAMLARIEYRLQLLTGGPRDLPPRQQSLRETLDWSYNLLPAGEQRLLRRLAVFAGGCTLEAVEVVTMQHGEANAPLLDQVATLLDHSLVYQQAQPDGTPRLFLLETTREYAAKQLQDAGESTRLRRSHAHYYLAMAEHAAPMLVGDRQQAALDELEREINNLRAALAWAGETTAEGTRDADLELGLRMHAALWRFWAYRTHLQEGRQSLAVLLARAAGTPVQTGEAYAAALTTAGLLAIRMSDFAGAAAALGAALARREAEGEAGRWGAAVALDGLGWAASAFGDFPRARRLYESALHLHAELGTLATSEGADVLAHLGMVEFMAGDPERARPLLAASLAHKRELGESWGTAFALYLLGAVAVRQGQDGDALACLREAYAISSELGEQLLRTFVLETLSWRLIDLAHNMRAGVAVYSAAAAMRDRGSMPQPPQWAQLMAEVMARAAQRLGEDACAAAWTEGRQMEPGAAFALGTTPTAEKRPAPVRSGSIFTAREADVLRLLAEGLSDAEIATALVLSVRTVHTHLQAVYGKLGVNSRTAALREARERRLLP